MRLARECLTSCYLLQELEVFLMQLKLITVIGTLDQRYKKLRKTLSYQIISGEKLPSIRTILSPFINLILSLVQISLTITHDGGRSERFRLPRSVSKSFKFLFRWFFRSILSGRLSAPSETSLTNMPDTIDNVL